jgi:hypothetical protein
VPLIDKKPYQRPELHVFGDIRSITKDKTVGVADGVGNLYLNNQLIGPLANFGS